MDIDGVPFYLVRHAPMAAALNLASWRAIWASSLLVALTLSGTARAGLCTGGCFEQRRVCREIANRDRNLCKGNCQERTEGTSRGECVRQCPESAGRCGRCLPLRGPRDLPTDMRRKHALYRGLRGATAPVRQERREAGASVSSPRMPWAACSPCVPHRLPAAYAPRFPAADLPRTGFRRHPAPLTSAGPVGDKPKTSRATE